MTTIKGYYYLHENSNLIYKNSPDAIIDIRDSDLCKSAWAWDGTPQTAWQICVEALSIGVNRDRILELANKWNVNDNDADNYANHLGLILGIDGNKKTATTSYFENIQQDACGFGDTYLEAMSDLCKQLGFTGGKMWNSTFEDLVK